MHPVLFEVGGTVISSYGAMLVLGFVCAWWLSSLEFRRKGLNANLLEVFLAAAMIGGMGGAKLMYIFENIPLTAFLDNPFGYMFSRGGLTYYGGLLGAAGLFGVTAWATKVNFFAVADAASPGTALAYAIARVGCFLVGDDYGHRSELPWALAFPEGSPPTLEKVHPTQIYEIALMVSVFLILWRLRLQPRQNGWLFGALLILGGLERFLVEFLRVTTPSPVPHISVAQLISAAGIALGIILVARASHREEQKSAKVGII